MLLLLEAQSSWTVNILIRILLYLAQSYHEYFERTSQSLYKSKKVKMPKPELYVIYTGNKGRKPDTISLSQEFFGGADIDIKIKAKVIYESDKDNICLLLIILFIVPSVWIPQDWPGISLNTLCKLHFPPVSTPNPSRRGNFIA